MAISLSSKKVLNPELDRLRLEKQRITGLIDKTQVQLDELKSDKAEIQASIDAIKADIDSL